MVTPVEGRHVENSIGIGKSTTHDAHDGDDDELQRFSKGDGTTSREPEGSVMGRPTSNSYLRRGARSESLRVTSSSS
jgi:hypothetical protein